MTPTESLKEVIGLLEPIADRNWDGKWRIKKAIEIIRQHGVSVCASTQSDGCDDCLSYETEIAEIVRVARDNPSDLHDFIMFNYPKDWGFSKLDYKALFGRTATPPSEGESDA